MAELFTTLFFNPILNLLVFFYNIVPGNDLAIAIILVTIVVKLVLLPLSQKALHSQKALQELQPKMEELKKKFKDQKEKLAQEMMKLYQTEKVNPLSSCLPLLIQLPFLFAIFRVFSDGLHQEVTNHLYTFIEDPGMLKTISYGGVDLNTPLPLLGILAGIGQYFQTKMLTKNKPKQEKKSGKEEDMASMVTKQMTIMMPVITIVLGFTFPAGLMLYWLATTILTILQQQFIFKKPTEPQQIKTG